MSLFRPARVEQRSANWEALTPRGSDNLGTGVDRALRLIPVYAATRLVTDDVSSLPVHQFRDLGDDRSQRTELSPLIADPTNFGTYTEWSGRALTSLMLRGNAYGMVQEWNVATGKPARIEWLHPDEVTVKDNRAVKRPEWSWLGKPVPRGDLIHIPAYVLPGRVLGISPIKAFAMQIDTGLMAQMFGRDFFKNGAHPSALLKNPTQQYDKDGAKRLRERFMKATAGRGPAILTAGWEYEAIQVAPEESQFIETLKLNATQIAAIYGVPPEKIGGETGRSLTYSTVEGDQIAYVQSTLRPYVVKLERHLSALLPEREFLKINTDAFVRVDIKTRYEAHRMAVQSGWRNVNEVRKIEDLEPIEGGDRYVWPPMNTVALTAEQAGIQPPVTDSTEGV